MTIEVRCAGGHKLVVPERFAGKSVRCSKCSRTVAVPKANDDDLDFLDLDEGALSEFALDGGDSSLPELPTAPREAARRSSRKQKPRSGKQDRDEDSVAAKTNGLSGLQLSLLGVWFLALGLIGVAVGSMLARPRQTPDSAVVAKSEMKSDESQTQSPSSAAQPDQRQPDKSDVPSVPAQAAAATGSAPSDPSPQQPQDRPVNDTNTASQTNPPPQIAEQQQPMPQAIPPRETVVQPGTVVVQPGEAIEQPREPVTARRQPNPRRGSRLTGRGVEQQVASQAVPRSNREMRPMEVVPLPAPAKEVIVAGSGRYLIASLPSLKKVAVFDVAAKQFVKQISVEERDIHIAAGESKLVIVQRAIGIITRYDLSSFARELTVGCPPYTSIAMGSSSEGPLLTIESTHPGQLKSRVLDLDTLKSGKVAIQSLQALFYIKNLQASADGRVFGGWLDYVKPTGMTICEIRENSLRTVRNHDNFGSILPSPDGRVIYCTAGRFDTEAKRLDLIARNDTQVLVPAATGPFYLALTSPDPPRTFGSKPVLLSVHLQTEEQSVVTPDDVVLPEAPLTHPEAFREASPLFQHLFFLPVVQMLVYLSPKSDQFVIQHFDVREELEKHLEDYLLVVSSPPIEVPREGELSYQIEVLSKQGDSKFKMVSGPEGMKVSDEGLVSWTVPTTFEPNEVTAVVNIQDKSEQTADHTIRFRLIAPSNLSTSAPDHAETPTPAPVVKKNVPAAAPAKHKAKLGNKPKKIRPRTLDIVKLPGPMHYPVVAGSGKYLIGVLPAQKQIAVLNVATKKIVKLIPVEDPKVQVAGGESRFVVFDPVNRQLSRYSLKTMAQDLNVSCGEYKEIAIGASSEGPVFAVGKDNLSLFDLETFQPINIGNVNRAKQHLSNPGNLRVSANGQVLACWANPSVSPTGMVVVEINNNQARTFYVHDNSGILLPSPDGRVIYNGHGPCTANGMSLDPGPHNMWQKSIPAATGPFYMGFNVEGVYGRPDEGPTRLDICCQSDRTPIFTAREIQLPEVKQTSDKLTAVNVMYLGTEKRLFLLPAVKALVTMPDSVDRFDIHNFDIREELDRSGIEYLFVTSTSPSWLEPGKQFHYPIEVMSKHGNVQYTLEMAPEGMAISKEGVVTWKIPADFPTTEDVVAQVVIQDDSGEEIVHTIKLGTYQRVSMP